MAYSPNNAAHNTAGKPVRDDHVGYRWGMTYLYFRQKDGDMIMIGELEPLRVASCDHNQSTHVCDTCHPLGAPAHE